MNLRERKRAKIYPIPGKKLKNCGVEELEEQLYKAYEAKAQEPAECHLPLITDSIFCEMIAGRYLTRKDVLNTMEVKEISGLFSLQKGFCTVHSAKLTRKKQQSDSADDTFNPDREALELQGKVNSSLPPLQPGEYDTIVPVTNKGLLIHVYPTGTSMTVLGFCRLPDGRKGPCERYRLIRNAGDTIVAVDGTLIAGKSMTELRRMVEKRRAKGCVFLRCRKDQANQNKIKDWKANHPSPNPSSCKLCHSSSIGFEHCAGCKTPRSFWNFYTCSVCSKRKCGENRTNCGHEKCYNCEKPMCFDCLERADMDCENSHCDNEACSAHCSSCARHIPWWRRGW